MNRALLLRTATVVAGSAALILGMVLPASAHVTVNPSTATQGGHAKVAFRVPNEKDDAETVKVEVSLPADKPISSVSLRPVNGWTAQSETTKLATPVTVNGSELTEAVTRITWTADADAAIKPGQFQEFEVSLGPLPATDRLVLKALQTYSDGDVVRWIDEPAPGTEPEHPAPVLTLAAPTATTSATPAPAAPTTEGDSGDGGNGNAYGVAGLLLGLAGLVTALLAYRRAAQTPENR
ncbi:YcnI family protein [Micromonospora sp. NPDC050417]|uniref:YcnI family protein n=1 Tax=Micromonospora sp. NPDC050417 TaxID=3364280 RepID=UPI00379D96FF